MEETLILEKEAEFVGECKLDRKGNLLRKRQGDYPGPVKTKDTYENIEEYINIQRSLIIEEYNLNKKTKSRLKQEAELNFVKLYESDTQHSFWMVVLPTRMDFIKKDVTGKEVIEITDDVHITWDIRNNGDLSKDFKEMNGKITAIRENKVHIKIKLSAALRPPDYVDPKFAKNSNRRKIKYKIKFLPSAVIFERKLLGVELLRTNEFFKNVAIGRIPNFPGEPRFNKSIDNITLTDTQKRIAKKAPTRPLTVVQGPPGCGKTYTIAAMIVACLLHKPEERVLVCGTSNTSVENLIRVVGDFVKFHKYKIAWLAAENRDLKDIISAKEEEKYQIFYQMCKRNTIEGRKFFEIQRKKWENEEVTTDEYKKEREFRKLLEKNIVKECNVLLTTLESAAKKCLDELSFPTVIVDEATQASEASTFIPLIHGAKRLILVGDQKQLGPRENILENYNYNISLFERIVNKLNFPYEFLDCQWRMNPIISEFSNSTFYEGRIRDMVTEEDRKLTTKTIPNNIVFINVNGAEEKSGLSYINYSEAEVVKSIVINMLRDNVKEKDIGVISPYASQARYIRNEIILSPVSKLKVATVDSFQGSEKEYIIISAVRTNLRTIGFLTNERRLNVSLTRAKRGLIIVGNEKALSNNEIWRNLINYCKKLKNSYYDGELPESTEFQIDDTYNQMEDYVYNELGTTPLYNDKDDVPYFNGKSGKNDKYTASSVSETETRNLWPDSEADMNELREWVNKKLEILKNNKNVTLSYDRECVCFQFSEVFPNDFDIFNWKQGDNIPPIRTDDSITVFFYNKENNLRNSEVPSSILRPLLEHPKITLLTYDFIADIDKLRHFDINVNMERLIDGQCLYANKKEKDHILTCSNKSLKSAIESLTCNDRLAINAKKEVQSGGKQFPWNANKFLISYYNFPKTAHITKMFLNYSTNDVYLTALVIVEAMHTNKLKYTIEKTKDKVISYNEKYKIYPKVSVFRQAERCRVNSTAIIRGKLTNEERIDSLLRKWRELEDYKKLILLNNEDINKILRLNSEATSSIDEKLGRCKRILYSEKQIRKVKALSNLANTQYLLKSAPKSTKRILFPTY